MNKLLSAATAAVMLALPTNALAATMDYDFQMAIQSIDDGYAAAGDGVFDEWGMGDYLDISVHLDTNGGYTIDIGGFDVAAETVWGSWSWASYSEGQQKWDAGGGMVGAGVTVNGASVGSGGWGHNLWLDFSETSSGNLELTAGALELRVNNSHNAKLTANFTGTPQKPTAVPELDPKSGMSTFALLGGGAAIALSRRRRQVLVTNRD